MFLKLARFNAKKLKSSSNSSQPQSGFLVFLEDFRKRNTGDPKDVVKTGQCLLFGNGSKWLNLLIATEVNCIIIFPYLCAHRAQWLIMQQYCSCLITMWFLVHLDQLNEFRTKNKGYCYAVNNNSCSYKSCVVLSAIEPQHLHVCPNVYINARAYVCFYLRDHNRH